MSLTSVIVRFSLLYTVLLVGGGLLMSALDIRASSINVVILAGTVVLVCTAFAKKNKRYFLPQEKVIVIAAMSGINVVLQLLFSWAAMVNSGLESVSYTILVGSVLYVCLLHTIAITIFVSLLKRGLVKRGVLPG